MGDYAKESYHIEGLMSTIVRLKNINNNSQDASVCELNGCQAMKPIDIQKENRTFCNDIGEAQEVLNEVLNENGKATKQETAMENFHGEEDIPAARSNESSSSNSTGNLSISQYDYADDDDVIFLANQQFADDDVSEQSDDCVYAYRGADFDVVEHRNNNNIDDETDFLEMDFEPDPASEIDNATNECHNGCRNCNPDPTADEILLPIQMVDESSTPKPVRPTFNSNHLQMSASSAEEWRNSTRNQNNISGDEGGEDVAATNFKFTGAKPKKQSLEKSSAVARSSSPRKPLQPETKAAEEIMAKQPMYRNGDGSLSDPDEPCIDCLEKEFLSTTVGRKMDFAYCKKCRRRGVDGYSELGAGDMNGFGLHISFDDSMVLQKPSVLEVIHPNVDNYLPSQNGDTLLKRTGKDSVTFSSVNIDEKIIIQALDHINVSFNKDMIKKHFEERSNFQPHLDNVTELILYNSKRNCDYKKTIKLIKLACNDDVDIKFTRDENVSKETEIVQVRSCDILEMWTIQQHNLERLKRLNKKFIQMNVLGKVINLIRHAQQRNTKSLEEEFIIVPQYYKTGYICITKK